MFGTELLEEITAVAGEDLSTLSAAARSDRVRVLGAIKDRADAALLLAVAAWDAADAWSHDGALTPAGWLTDNTPMSKPEACEVIRAGRMLWSSDRLTKLLAEADLSATKVRVLSRVAIPDRADLFRRDADLLADVAQALEPDDLRRAAQRWADHADDELGRGEPRDRHERRGATFRTFGEWAEVVIRGPQADVETIRAAADRLAPPDPTSAPGGPRRLSQRRFDAIVEMARRALGGANGRVDPENTVDVIIDWDTLQGRYNPDGRCQTMNGHPVDRTTVERLLCDSWLSRVIVGADGEVLDLGRRARLFTPAQRRAIKIRDGGCVACGAPPEWCDVHHHDPWAEGGSTDVDNGVTLCRQDHVRIHEGGWSLTRTAAGSWHLQPP